MLTKAFHGRTLQLQYCFRRERIDIGDFAMVGGIFWCSFLPNSNAILLQELILLGYPVICGCP